MNILKFLFKNKIQIALKLFLILHFLLYLSGYNNVVFAKEINLNKLTSGAKIMELSNTEIFTHIYIEEQQIKEQEEKEINTIHYVALGNSITCNEVCDYWWGTWGMAASNPNKDYVHLVSEYIMNQTEKNIDMQVVSIKEWEIPQTEDRNMLLSNLNKYINENTDIITLQCGENVTTFKESFPSDFSNLISYIKEKAPNAQIIVLPNLLWDFEDIENAKESICEQNNIPVVNMNEYIANYDALYKSAIGTQVTGIDGQMHSIWYEAVAVHPNDAGMAKIAQEIISCIDVKKIY